MNEVFALNHRDLATNPRFTALAGELSTTAQIDSRDSFNRYCRDACQRWSKHFPSAIGTATSQFTFLLHRVSCGGEGIIQTPWGGVVIERHQHPCVEKFLVIRKGGYLALEKHDEKDERLQVVEGAGLLLSRRCADDPLAVRALAPGDRFHFQPGMEHCLIGTENLLVFERSIDPKGMDQDLIFIYEPTTAS